MGVIIQLFYLLYTMCLMFFDYIKHSNIDPKKSIIATVMTKYK